jgi:hypothetical protein
MMHLEPPGSPALRVADMGSADAHKYWRGAASAATLLLACPERGASMQVETPVSRLISEDGWVNGMHASWQGRPVEFGARHVPVATAGVRPQRRTQTALDTYTARLHMQSIQTKVAGT